MLNFFTIIKNISDSIIKGEGVLFPNGKVVVYWSGKINTIVYYDNLNDFSNINGKIDLKSFDN